MDHVIARSDGVFIDMFDNVYLAVRELPSEGSSCYLVRRAGDKTGKQHILNLNEEEMLARYSLFGRKRRTCPCC